LKNPTVAVAEAVWLWNVQGPEHCLLGGGIIILQLFNTNSNNNTH